jgi:hypothetical protein
MVSRFQDPPMIIIISQSSSSPPSPLLLTVSFTCSCLAWSENPPSLRTHLRVSFCPAHDHHHSIVHLFAHFQLLQTDCHHHLKLVQTNPVPFDNSSCWYLWFYPDPVDNSSCSNLRFDPDLVRYSSYWNLWFYPDPVKNSPVENSASILILLTILPVENWFYSRNWAGKSICRDQFHETT